MILSGTGRRRRLSTPRGAAWRTGAACAGVGIVGIHVFGCPGGPAAQVPCLEAGEGQESIDPEHEYRGDDDVLPPHRESPHGTRRHCGATRGDSLHACPLARPVSPAPVKAVCAGRGLGSSAHGRLGRPSHQRRDAGYVGFPVRQAAEMAADGHRAAAGAVPGPSTRPRR